MNRPDDSTSTFIKRTSYVSVRRSLFESKPNHPCLPSAPVLRSGWCVTITIVGASLSVSAGTILSIIFLAHIAAQSGLPSGDVTTVDGQYQIRVRLCGWLTTCRIKYVARHTILKQNE
jgi:hypothetical protein